MYSIQDKLKLNIGDVFFRLAEVQCALDQCIVENDQLRLRLAKYESPAGDGAKQEQTTGLANNVLTMPTGTSNG